MDTLNFMILTYFFTTKTNPRANTANKNQIIVLRLAFVTSRLYIPDDIKMFFTSLS